MTTAQNLKMDDAIENLSKESMRLLYLMAMLDQGRIQEPILFKIEESDLLKFPSSEIEYHNIITHVLATALAKRDPETGVLTMEPTLQEALRAQS